MKDAHKMNPVEPYDGDEFDGSWANEWVVSDGLQRTKTYDQLVQGRLLPCVGDPEQEAEKAKQDFWNAKMSEPVGDGGDVDPGSIADDAHEKGLEVYELLFPLRQSALNLVTAGLFHLLEQTSTSLGRAWKRGDCAKFEHFVDWLRDVLGLDLRVETFWPAVRELHMVANVIKHGEGWSADELRTINAALFSYPGTHGLVPWPKSPVASPLAGEEIYVSVDDYQRYLSAALAFWNRISTHVQGKYWTIPK